MVRVILSTMLIVLIAGCAKTGQHSQKSTQSTPMMDQEQAMKNWEEASRVRPEHARLKDFSGKWNVEMKHWMEPGAKPEVSKGVSNNQLVLGGRYLKQEFKGKAMGKPFQGMGLMGFDNVKNQYTSQWYDSMSTSTMNSEGTYIPSDKTIELTGNYYCPLRNAEMTAKERLTFVDKNHHVFEMYDVNPDGKEVKTMEIHYTRAG